MNVLVIDIGGTHVKLLATGQDAPRQFLSGPELTSEQMVAGVVQAAAGWGYEAVSVGYPGPVLRGRPLLDPVNLGPGWVGFDFAAAFGRPVAAGEALARGDLIFWKGHVGVMRDARLLLHANATHMLVTSEPLDEVRARNLKAGAGDVTAIKRLDLVPAA